jgi:hypothetical protein
MLFGTEIWAYLIVLFIQDLPFAVLRISVLINYDQLTKNYTLYFFVVKNVVLALSEIYYIVLILINDKGEKEHDQPLNEKNRETCI